MTDFSPFSIKRYEHAGDHVYYLPQKAFRELERSVPTYLVGTRGTGKTTLLKALSWEERLYNKSLHSQLKEHAFDSRYVGIYFKLPNVQLDLIDYWLTGANDADYAALTAFYLDLCWLEALQDPLRHLGAREIAKISRAAEDSAVEEFTSLWRQYPECEQMFGEPGNSIPDILRLMHPLRRRLEHYARSAVPSDQVLEGLPVGQAGSFGRAVGKIVMRALDRSSEDDQPRWSLRICMDEGEVLSLRQQRAVNSMVRLTEWPVFCIVAYVSRPPDVTSTLLPNQTLQHADRQILVRDDMTDAEFKQLAQGVVDVRLHAHYGKRKRLRADAILGPLDINGLLLRILRRSEDQDMRDLLEQARAAAEDSEAAPPIYETYLRLRRPELANARPSGKLARRRQSSASIRKQMVAAYLSICRESSNRPMYASADMVYQVSDKCVRDFLWQMESIFAESELSLEKFLESRIDPGVQSVGMRKAADLKMTLFRERILSEPAEANQFVSGLARVTALIQSTGRNYEQIRSPERGIFAYRTNPTMGSDLQNRHLQLIRDASEAGFLRIVNDENSEEIRFRVHASLAPKYDFSYRGAYYAAGLLDDEDIHQLRTSSTNAELTSAVAQIATRITGRRSRGTPGQQALPDTQEDRADGS